MKYGRNFFTLKHPFSGGTQKKENEKDCSFRCSCGAVFGGSFKTNFPVKLCVGFLAFAFNTFAFWGCLQ